MYKETASTTETYPSKENTMIIYSIEAWDNSWEHEWIVGYYSSKEKAEEVLASCNSEKNMAWEYTDYEIKEIEVET
jgi:hypothetical protein